MNPKTAGKIRVTRERSFSAHHMLIGAARAALQDAEQKRPGWAYSQLTAIALCGLAVEAICNAFGDRLITEWTDFETASPRAKLRLLCEHMGIPYDTAKKPWADVRWLLRLRNRIAHAKPQKVKTEHIWTRDEYEQKRGEMPLSDLELDLSLDHAKRAVTTVQQVLQILSDALSIRDRFALFSDAWTASAIDEDVD